MSRYKVTVAYDGSSFLGWQKQSEGRTVQTEIEKILSQILDTPTPIFASGRTDAGVHALGQVFHFDCEKPLDLGKIKYALNCLLPEDIHILSIEEVDSDFHARYGVVKKYYRYILNMGEANPLQRQYRYEMHQTLDIAKMKEAAVLFLGTQNFMNFTSKEEDEDKFTRTLYSLNIAVENDVVTFDLIGQGFMRYMARMIVGTLVAIGQGKEDLSFVSEMLHRETRKIISYKAPSQGLYLVHVSYGEDD